MSRAQIIKLLALSAIWGSSFIFMKVLAPELGPIRTTFFRIFIGGLFLIFLFKFQNKSLNWKENWKQYLWIGVINSALPFCLYTFAALYIPASYSVVINSTSPLFGMIFAVVLLSHRIVGKQLIGVFLGTFGVAIMSLKGPLSLNTPALLSIFACLGAAACYGFCGAYIRRYASHIESSLLAGGSQLLGSLPLLLLSPWMQPLRPWDWSIVASLLALAILCSSIAYLLYYGLISDVGPSKALTVTFLMPLFGILWGYLFLSELITFPVILGTGFVIAGTWFVTRAKE